MKTYDVIISGGGPVGLFLACELTLAHCSVLILEKALEPQSPLKRLPFGIRGLSAPTIEALYRRGLLEELEIHKRLKNPHQNAVQGPRRQAGHFAGIPFHEGDIDMSCWTHRIAGSTPTSLISEIEELETVLTRRAESLGVEITRGVAVSGSRLGHGCYDRRITSCNDLDGPGETGYDLPQRAGSFSRGCGAYSRPVGRSGSEPWAWRCPESWRQACGNRSGYCGGRFAGPLLFRTASYRGPGAGLVTGAGGAHAARSRSPGVVCHCSRSDEYARRSYLFCGESVGYLIIL